MMLALRCKNVINNRGEKMPGPLIISESCDCVRKRDSKLLSTKVNIVVVAIEEEV